MLISILHLKLAAERCSKTVENKIVHIMCFEDIVCARHH